jgi:proliferating cell nuclear antigen
MDTAHVVLVNLLLRADGFEPYRCDRTIPLGLSIQSMHKVNTEAAKMSLMFICLDS